MSKHNDNKSYQFTFSGNAVTAVYETRGGRIKQDSIDHDETYVRDGSIVTKIELEHGRQEVTTYSDPDGDGNYMKIGKASLPASSITVSGATITSSSEQDQYRFQLGDGSFADGDLVDANDVITLQYELGRRGWKPDFLDRNESIGVQQLDNTAFIVSSELERSGSWEFSVYGDVDGDGIWQEILEGHATADYANQNGIDLVGLVDAGLLNPDLLGL